jgi:5,10-methenyltetrahydrofolate synthetase
MNDEDQPQKPYASPACYAHELDELYRDTALPDRDTWNDVMRWRKAERERLRTLRGALDDGQRALALEIITARLDELLELNAVTVLGAYWPIQGEPDLRAWLRRRADGGLVIALPVIHTRNQPLKYSRWQPKVPMRRGVWGIAEPAVDDWIEPQMVLAPSLGVDRQQYRLGYGGGYFDRSLAAADPPRQAVGIGYGCAHIATIYPQPHDIPMDFVVTG